MTKSPYLIKRYGEANNNEEVMILEKDLSGNEKKPQVIKIYKQFGQGSIESIKKNLLIM